jgi:hypothetical protein
MEVFMIVPCVCRLVVWYFRYANELHMSAVNYTLEEPMKAKRGNRGIALFFL